MKILLASLASLTLTACATTGAPPAPPKPIISCNQCSGLLYYGEQAPARSESVQIAGMLAGAATQIAGFGFAADAAKSLTQTVAGAGRIEVIEQPAQLPPTVVRPEVILVPEGSTAVATE